MLRTRRWFIMPNLSYQELIEPVARALLGEPNERVQTR